jgi:hypothetical protein
MISRRWQEDPSIPNDQGSKCHEWNVLGPFYPFISGLDVCSSHTYWNGVLPFGGLFGLSGLAKEGRPAPVVTPSAYLNAFIRIHVLMQKPPVGPGADRYIWRLLRQQCRAAVTTFPQPHEQVRSPPAPFRLSLSPVFCLVKIKGNIEKYISL